MITLCIICVCVTFQKPQYHLSNSIFNEFFSMNVVILFLWFSKIVLLCCSHDLHKFILEWNIFSKEDSLRTSFYCCLIPSTSTMLLMEDLNFFKNIFFPFNNFYMTKVQQKLTDFCSKIPFSKNRTISKPDKRKSGLAPTWCKPLLKGTFKNTIN